jgi:hypothetical protein
MMTAHIVLQFHIIDTFEQYYHCLMTKNEPANNNTPHATTLSLPVVSDSSHRPSGYQRRINSDGRAHC